MGKTAFIYCRISQDRTGAGLGTARQEEDCIALAEKLGVEVVRTFVDQDISAYSGKKRPAYEEMLKEMAVGHVDYVLCWHTDRLHRSPRELETYIDVSSKHGIATHAVRAGELDLATPSGRAVARTLGAWARYESEMKSDRQKRQRMQAREDGRWTGGVVPFGWDIISGQPEVNPEQADMLRYAVDQIHHGASISSLLRYFNNSEHRPPRSATWNHISLKDMLVRPKIAGLREVNGEVLDDPVFPAIVTEDQWRGVRALLGNPDRRVSFDNRNKWLLSGIALCECGSDIRVGATKDHRGGRRAIYRCKVTGPGHINRNAENVDEFVNLVVPKLLEKRTVVESVQTPQVDDIGRLQGEASALRARLAEAASMAADGILTMAQLGVMSKKLKVQLAEIERSMESAVIASRPVHFDAHQRWEEMTLEQKRAILRILVKVTILRTGHSKGRNFDYDSIKIELAEDEPQ
jgi:DNA invertase Pin-like site-specific DNA recombinase